MRHVANDERTRGTPAQPRSKASEPQATVPWSRREAYPHEVAHAQNLPRDLPCCQPTKSEHSLTQMRARCSQPSVQGLPPRLVLSFSQGLYHLFVLSEVPCQLCLVASCALEVEERLVVEQRHWPTLTS